MITLRQTSDGEKVTIHTRMSVDDWSYLQASLNMVMIDLLSGELSNDGKEGMIMLIKVVNESIPDERQYSKGLEPEKI